MEHGRWFRASVTAALRARSATRVVVPPGFDAAEIPGAVVDRDALPRLVPTHPQTWISGPSATSDIELERGGGCPRPRTLHVVLVGP